MNFSPSYPSRRRFIASAGVLTAAAWLSPRHLFAESENIVLTARKRAETANITVQPLRGNVSALIGSGGNIGVLTGPDGKMTEAITTMSDELRYRERYLKQKPPIPIRR